MLQMIWEKIEKLIKEDFIGQLEFFERTLGPYPWGEEKIGIVEIPYLRHGTSDHEWLWKQL